MVCFWCIFAVLTIFNCWFASIVHPSHSLLDNLCYDLALNPGSPSLRQEASRPRLALNLGTRLAMTLYACTQEPGQLYYSGSVCYQGIH